MTEAGFNPGVEWMIETDSGVCGLIPTGGDTEIECLQWPDPVETATLDSPVKSVGLLGLILEDGRLVVPASSDPAEFFEMRVAGKIIQSGLSVMYNLCVLIDEGTLFCTSYPVYEGDAVPTYPIPFSGPVSQLGSSVALLENGEVWSVEEAPRLIPVPSKAKALLGGTWIMAEDGQTKRGIRPRNDVVPFSRLGAPRGWEEAQLWLGARGSGLPRIYGTTCARSIWLGHSSRTDSM